MKVETSTIATRSKMPMAPQTSSDSMTPADEALLAAVAIDHDKSAFEQLAKRFTDPAYNLALHLCRDPEMAEDCLQDALVGLWKHARQFDPSKAKARSWFLRIVANKTLQAMSKEGRERKRAMKKQAEMQAVLEVEAAPDSNELSVALHCCLGRLPRIERQIVALYYGADFSQNEISKLLELPQRTVSYRLQQSLQNLRESLTAAGFAASLPLLQTGALGDALLNGVQIPHGLHVRIMNGITKAAGRSARIGAATASKSSMGVWLFATLVALASGLGWWAFSEKELAVPENPVRPTENKTVTQEIALETPVESGFKPRVFIKDDFSNGDLWTAISRKVRGFRWSSNGGVSGSPCLMADSDRGILEFDLKEDACPLIIELERQIERPKSGEKNEFGLNGLWMDFDEFAQFFNFGEFRRRKVTSFFKLTIYMTPDFCLAVDEAGEKALTWFSRKPGTRVGLSFYGRQRIDNLLVRTAAQEEMPDLSMYLKAVESVPAEQRDGRLVTLPDLPCERKDESIQVRFYDRMLGSAEQEDLP